MDNKRRDYKSLDEMAQNEGVIAVLEFLAHHPTMISGIYRHTQIPIVPFEVKKNHEMARYLESCGK
jgi:hypothetical protein